LLIYQVVLEPKQVFIFGYAGHSYVVIESLLDAGYQVSGYFDYKEATKNPYKLEYLGFEKEVDLKSIVKNHLVFPTVGENIIRQKLVQLFAELKLKQFTAIDPSAMVSKSANIGESTYIGKNTVVNAQTSIGRGVILNSQSTIEHECTIHDFVHIAPGAVLCGNVLVGDQSFVGANSVIKNNLTISNEVVIGSGSVVIRSIIDKGTWIGNPARQIK